MEEPFLGVGEWTHMKKPEKANSLWPVEEGFALERKLEREAWHITEISKFGL